MDGTVLIVVLIVAVVLLVAIFAMGRARTKRSEALREKFGPEYERTVTEAGDQRSAEKRLQEREERRDKLEIRELDESTRERYATEWRSAQTRFVDDPSPAVRDADSLVINVMRDRGYPVDDFEQRTDDVSVDHPHVVENYRAAHGIFLADEQGRATTEDLRQAMVHYRVLFGELLGDFSAAQPDSRTERSVHVDQVDLREEHNPRA